MLPQGEPDSSVVRAVSILGVTPDVSQEVNIFKHFAEFAHCLQEFLNIITKRVPTSYGARHHLFCARPPRQDMGFSGLRHSNIVMSSPADAGNLFTH